MGLRNLGQTCYMASAIQCLSAVEPLSKYFLKPENYQSHINRTSRDG